MKKIISLLVVCGLVASCSMSKKSVETISAPLYQSKAFSVYADKVVQGNYTAQVVSPTEIRSNYKSPANATFSRLIKFKISINEKDNEMPPGRDHWVLIGNEHESPLITFGEPIPPFPPLPNTYLPVNYTYTFRIDMTPVIKQFNEKGYYEAFDGSRVAKSDFKGFYLAGGSDPLSWDFVNLHNKGLQLKDSGKDNIYTLTLKFNPWEETDAQDKVWRLGTDLSQRPQYHSEQPVVDALFNLSLEEAIKNIEKDSTFRTGAKWGGVWTRDVSYSTLLAFAYHEPEVAKTSLRKKVKRGRIVQDTGSGGAWPVSSDRTTWALAAWEIYKATGDQNWLKEAWQVIKNSVLDDDKTIFDAETGLCLGESSFLDWREQTYPKWMSNMDIYVSQNLGTNVVHYQTNRILAQMARILGEPGTVFEQKAARIKAGINRYLWMADKGYYAQYRYGRPYLMNSPRFEALGEALAVLFDVADAEKADSILSRSPITDYGVSCIYPQIPGIPPYHNNGVWPFVQSYWNLAAAKAGNEAALTQGLAAIYRAGALFLTNYENFVAGTGDFLGTEINSDRMLWSMAGNLAMVHRVFMGMSFEPNGIRFQPVVPRAYGGKKTLSNFRYRKALLQISVNGHGNRIKSFTLDGKALKDAFFPASLTGAHKIEIELENNAFESQTINQVPNLFSLPNPQVSLRDGMLEWEHQAGAQHYNLYKNGQFVSKIQGNHFPVTDQEPNLTVWQVSAVDEGGIESFCSEPVRTTAANRIKTVEIEDFAPPSTLPFSNFSGKGFVEISSTLNTRLACTVNAPESGDYYLQIRYSNGSGPWNTDNKCAIRTLYVEGVETGVLVFPQRGKDEWSDWGYSNSRLVHLKKGENRVSLVFEDWNNNMNVEVNRAMVDQVVLIPR